MACTYFGFLYLLRFILRWWYIQLVTDAASLPKQDQYARPTEVTVQRNSAVRTAVLVPGTLHRRAHEWSEILLQAAKTRGGR